MRCVQAKQLSILMRLPLRAKIHWTVDLERKYWSASHCKQSGNLLHISICSHILKFQKLLSIGHKNKLNASSIIFIMSEILFGLPKFFPTIIILFSFSSILFSSIIFVYACVIDNNLTFLWPDFLVFWLFSLKVFGCNLPSYAIHRTQTSIYSVLVLLSFYSHSHLFLVSFFFFPIFATYISTHMVSRAVGETAYAFISLLELLLKLLDILCWYILLNCTTLYHNTEFTYNILN